MLLTPYAILWTFPQGLWVFFSLLHSQSEAGTVRVVALWDAGRKKSCQRLLTWWHQVIRSSYSQNLSQESRERVKPVCKDSSPNNVKYYGEMISHHLSMWWERSAKWCFSGTRSIFCCGRKWKRGRKLPMWYSWPSEDLNTGKMKQGRMLPEMTGEQNDQEVQTLPSASSFFTPFPSSLTESFELSLKTKHQNQNVGPVPRVNQLLSPARHHRFFLTPQWGVGQSHRSASPLSVNVTAWADRLKGKSQGERAGAFRVYFQMTVLRTQ